MAPEPSPASNDTGVQAGAQADEAQDASNLVNCPRCGTPVPPDATFCTECGNRLTTA
jgi:ribosomal protein L40E